MDDEGQEDCGDNPGLSKIAKLYNVRHIMEPIRGIDDCRVTMRGSYSSWLISCKSQVLQSASWKSDSKFSSDSHCDLFAVCTVTPSDSGNVLLASARLVVPKYVDGGSASTDLDTFEGIDFLVNTKHGNQTIRIHAWVLEYAKEIGSLSWLFW